MGLAGFNLKGLGRDNSVMSDVTVQEFSSGKVGLLQEWASLMYSLNPSSRGQSAFSLMWHCCSTCVIQHCLSNRILKFNHKRYCVWNFNKGFYIAHNWGRSQWKNLLRQECHPARGYTQQWLWELMMSKAIKILVEHIMLENIGSPMMRWIL